MYNQRQKQLKMTLIRAEDGNWALYMQIAELNSIVAYQTDPKRRSIRKNKY